MPNALAAATSPYLRQHADNPVAWLPWGDDAFARARAGQKPIFLSIGYSTCHWCHVMARESFEDPALAAVLNRDFVPVKVDREERPDLDRIYMAFVQHTTGHGGWPMSVWLTPDGKPFHGGTYYPPDDRAGRPGFGTVLAAVTHHWQTERARLEAGAEEIVAGLRRLATGADEAPAPTAGGAPTLAAAAATACRTACAHADEAHDPRWGGFGGAPKFPRAPWLHFLLRAPWLPGVATDDAAEAVRMAAFTLQRMSEGGLHDHVGGGFHRYSVDEQWHVPHFEKMLHDQAQLATLCLEARVATGLEPFAWVARGILDYVQRDLTAPEGGCYAAEDADSATAAGGAGHAEGAFYVWSREEFDTVLGADAAFVAAHFDVRPGGNVAHDPQGEFTGRCVLRQRRPLAATAAAAGLTPAAATTKLLDGLARLRAVRARRPRPARDEKILAAWNGLMLTALARGAVVLGEPAHLAAATRAAEFLQRELFDAATGTLRRSWCGGRSDLPGFAEDYAGVIQGLLDLYEAGADLRWLQWAEQLQQAMDARFWDDAQGGYFNSRADDPTVIARLKEDYDGAEPAPTSLAALNLLRLDAMTGLAGARARAEATLASLRARWTRAPHALPQLLAACELLLAPPRTVVLAGAPASAEGRALAAVVATRPGPRRALLWADGAAGQAWLAERRPYLATLRPAPGQRATAYVCEDFTCRAPVSDPAALAAALG